MPTDAGGAQGARRTGSFTEREIELVLLRRMADLSPELVERALRTAGTSRAEMREANRRWNAAGFGRPGPLRLSRYRLALGVPVVDCRPLPTPQGSPELALTRSAWPLSLWPGLWLQVLADRAGVVQHVALVRADDEPSPPLRTAADVVPWGCTLSECAAAFATAAPDVASAAGDNGQAGRGAGTDAVTFVDVDLTGHEAIAVTAADGDGVLARWLIRSVWGLVQRIEPAPPHLS